MDAVNPFFAQVAGTLVRAALLALSGWAVQHGILTESDAGRYVEAVVLASVPILWSLVQKYKGRRKLVVAVKESKFDTEAELEDHILNSISAGVALPPVTTPKDEPPKAA